jgi:hypothetical protein
MAFNKLGYFTIKSGESFEIIYWFGGNEQSGGRDHGAQYCMADPEAAPGTLWVTQQGKERSSIPLPGAGTSGYLYHVVVGYQAPPRFEMAFTLQGGGLV